MRKIIVLLAAALMTLGVGGAVLADGPGGSTEGPLCAEGDTDCDSEQANQVTCGDGEAVEDLTVYASENGIEVCNDNDDSDLVNGRIIITPDDGGYVAIDGDDSNEEPANGYLRVDEGGPHCGNDSNQDSTADQSANTAEDCG